MNETRQNSYCQNKNKSKEVKYKKRIVFNLQKGEVRKRAEKEREREREKTYFVGELSLHNQTHAA